jgi:hypothetical protein
MTLIAALGFASSEPQAVLFGDLLLTGPRIENSPQPLPTHLNAHEFFGGFGWGIVGMCQKVCLLSDTMAVAWAGSWLGARIAIQALRDRFANVPTKPAEILDYLKGEPELKQHPASFVGFTLADGMAHPFYYDAEYVETPTLGAACIAGSGAKTIIDYASALKNSGQSQNSLRPVALAFNLGAWLLSNEFRGREAAPTLRNMFGGGYEVVYLRGQVLVKPTEYTYWLWEAFVDRTTNIIRLGHPDLVVKQAYHHDHLLIRSATLTRHAETGNFNLSDQGIQIVRPMYDTKDQLDPRHIENLPFGSDITSHCVLARDETGILGILPYTKFSMQSDIHLSISEGKFIMQVDRVLLDELQQKLRCFLSPR